MTGRLARRAVAWLRDRPATLAIAGLVLAASITATLLAAADRTALLRAIALGPAQVFERGAVWTLVTYPLAAVGWGATIVSVAVVVALLGIVERRLGAARLVLAWLVTTVVGGLLAVFAVRGIAALDITWFTPSGDVLVLAPGAGAVGTLLAGSAAQLPAARRRIRVLALLVLALLVVSIGRPVDLALLTAGLVGLALGALARHRGHATHWRRSDAFERRSLLAGATLVLGVAPIVALFAPNGHRFVHPLIAVGGTVESVTEVVPGCVATSAETCYLGAPLAGLTPIEVALSVVPWLPFLAAAWGIWRGMRLAVWITIALDLVVVTLVGWFWVVGPFLAAGAESGGTAPRTDATKFIVQTVVVLCVYLLAAVVAWRWRESCALRPERARVLRHLAAVGATAVLLVAGYVAFVLADPTAWDWQPTESSVLDVPAFETDPGADALPDASGAPDADAAFDGPDLAPLLPTVLADAPERLLPFALLITTPERLVPLTPLATFVAWSIAPVFHLVVLASVVRMVRRGRLEERHLDRAELDAALRRGGGTSLAHMATWPNMRHWVDEATGAIVPYRLERGCALVLGGPVGAPETPPVPVLARFATVADARGWIPAVYAAPGTLVDEFESIGWHCVEVGEESVLRPLEWSMQGKKWQNVRTSINRAKREGVQVRWTRYGELTVAQARELRDMSTEWAGEKGLPEMGFTLGGVDELDDPDVRLALAVHDDGRIEAVTSWLPTWRDGVVEGWTLDFMRRRPDGLNGVMEMLIAQVAEQFQEEGVSFMSLSAAPLASSVGPDATPDQASVLMSLLGYLGERLEPVYGFRSLLRFKQKFQPELHPIVLAYGDPVHLPAIGLALTEAYLPGVSFGQLASSFRKAKAEQEREAEEAARPAE